ncbi:33269_t:CDS:2, partial [Racocetra persica]
NSNPFKTSQENNVKSQKLSVLLPHDSSSSAKSVSDRSSPLSETRINALFPEITQLKLNKSSDDDDDEYMIELKLNEGNNMRCYTYDEEVPDLPSDLVINDESSSGSKNCGLSSGQALEKLVKIANDILDEHNSPLQTSK